ncbi:zinc ribbon domain-containing protein [Luteolibacter algae]|uniref:Zinc ribbon domain-containing protein n=1 Tax=Luteolibacter algae TaxID=454151 RepID=A0ABW5DAK7_9BACT
MLEEIRGLLILQDRDRRLLGYQKELAKLPQDEARAKARLAGDTANLKKAHDELKAAELKVKKIEMDVQTRRTTIQRLRTQQFETKKNDEYNALGHEITRYEKEVDTFETLELEAMEEVDIFRKKHADAEGELAKTQKIVDEDLALIKQRKAKTEELVSEVQAERDKLVLDVSDDYLPIYNKLMKSKDGMAIATLRNGQCTGCHVKVIASTVIAVQSEKEVTQCENCGRILSVDE